MAEVTLVEAPPPAPPPAPTTQITPASMPAPATPPPAPKPGSAREKMFESLRKKAVANDPTVPAPEPATPPAPRPGNEPPPSPETPETPEPGEPAEPAAPDPTKPAAAKPKQNPWKLYESEKTKRAELEQQLAQFKEKLVPEADREVFTKRLTETEARAKELEDEIRYVNYSKSAEFKEKYEAPYEKAWARAMGELSEIGIVDPQTNEQRAVSAQDLLTLVNLPLGKARELANAVFGDFADDVMGHRKEIRTLFDQRDTALKEAREKGAEREKVRKEQYEQFSKQATEHVKKIWETANQAVHKDEKYGKYFVPVEGDEEGNQRLGKGFQLVDRAFSDPSPTDPRLTPEQRADIVRRHAAVRNRAAAFGRLVLRTSQLESKLAAAEKELQQYKASTPSPTTETRPGGNGQPIRARDQVFGALRKLAK